MTDILNRVAAVIRLSGSAANLKAIQPSILVDSARLALRPPGVPHEIAPEAALVFEVSLINQESIEPAISQVLDLVNVAVVDFAAVSDADAFAVEVECIVHLYAERPVYEISAKTLSRVCALGACLGLDIYDSRPDGTVE